MTARNTAKRAVDGVLLLDKPVGITSSAAVQKVRRLFSAAKAGHTGTLDPQATGLLPVCLGEATKFAHLLLDADKRYLAVVRLGVTTDTGDLEGKVLARGDGRRTRADIEAALARFRGPVQQTPPMYSAVKHDGQRLYRLARAGTEVAREPRGIYIHELVLEGLKEDEITLSVTCSKGTYIRVLAEDIGKALGCGACLAGLRRGAVGGMALSPASVTLRQLEDLAPARRDALLLPPDTLVLSLPRLDLDMTEAGRILRGQAVQHDGAGETGLARIYGPDQAFLGVVEITSPGRILPRRLRAQARHIA
ncbi:MAG TPA: tRNA pseudouridine(55) synthase TruB [Burkholderiales bacterium]|nr:tRNA pseudouridine(55) synthase TruB [Burkholderiales bacterium]